jgi:hypothetical protein
LQINLSGRTHDICGQADRLPVYQPHQIIGGIEQQHLGCKGGIPSRRVPLPKHGLIVQCRPSVPHDKIDPVMPIRPDEV